FELGGQLAAVLVDDGDRVDRNGVLARLDTNRLDAQRAEAAAALAEARSASDFANRSLERNKAAAEFEGISAQELDLAVDAANAAQAGVTAAEARLNRIDVDLEKSVLRAPFDAIVVLRRFDEGQIVGGGQPVLDVLEVAPPEVRVGLSGDLANTLSPGDEHVMRIDGRSSVATLRTVLPVRDPATRTVDAIFTLAAGAALPGDLARLELEQPIEEEGVWLPISALAEGSRGLWTAYVAVPLEGTVDSSGATHSLEPRAVELLYQGTDRVYVRGALADGELFVSEGLTRVVPHQEVRVDVHVASGELPANGS
ncbi:MAG: efflux RND transporter periplasmic adaptor subunit, partial [Pseudomonadota bacterium]